MADWLKDLAVTRSHPALWIEHVWLVGSKEPVSVIREFTLRPGVNVIWAQEPEDNAITGRQAAGHGVGKTSLCLLLRYVLCDEAETILALRDEAQGRFPDGGIGATVHLGNETWTVFRPFSAYRTSIAQRAGMLESLFSSEAGNQFEEYRTALAEAFIHPLPVAAFPGSGQTIEWRHLLAWCTRDQRTRFDSFFHWRAGEGVGFRRARQDPPLLMKAVLGILDVETASLLSDIETAGQQLSKLEKHIEELEREPLFNLNRVEHALRRAVGADAATPIDPPDLISKGVLCLLEEQLKRRVTDEQKLETEIQEIDENRQRLFQQVLEAEDDEKFCELEYARLDALIEGNEKEYGRISTEMEILRTRKGRCQLGNVEFSDCDHIKHNLATVSFQKQRYLNVVNTVKSESKDKQRALIHQLEAQKHKVANLRTQTEGLRIQARSLEMRRATSAIERKHTAELQQEYSDRKHAQTKGTESAELTSARGEKSALEQRQQSLMAKEELKRHQVNTRVTQLRRLTELMAERLLGIHAVGILDEYSDFAPFRLAVGGEAFHVMEVLLGDIVCLLDSITSTDNLHPAFLIHDCPREADMSAHLYQDFLEVLLEIESYAGQTGMAPFQYVLTTTSPPPKEMQQEPHLRLVLRPGNDENQLFKKQLSSSSIAFSA